jgi:hypothetical protein
MYPITIERFWNTVFGRNGYGAKLRSHTPVASALRQPTMIGHRVHGLAQGKSKPPQDSPIRRLVVLTTKKALPVQSTRDSDPQNEMGGWVESMK